MTRRTILCARHRRFWLEIGAGHPSEVRRVRQLVDWVSSGELDRMRAGGCILRGNEPTPSAEFQSAEDHYSQRAGAMMERATKGVQGAVDQVSASLRARQNTSGDNDDDGDTFARGDADLD